MKKQTKVTYHVGVVSATQSLKNQLWRYSVNEWSVAGFSKFGDQGGGIKLGNPHSYEFVPGFYVLWK